MPVAKAARRAGIAAMLTVLTMVAALRFWKSSFQMPLPFSPTIGAALNVTLLSYNGTCGVGVTVDTAAVPDIEVFMACLAKGFEEVLALAGPDVRVTT